MAPTGSVITLFASAPSVPANGQIEIVATVIEHGTATTGTGTGTGVGTGTTPPTTSTPASGTPVQNGTLVSFTSTLGQIDPRDARTKNGEVRVKFIANGQSGTASITAYSGGASGTLTDLLVGTAAAKRIRVTATPQTLGSSGGTAQVTARVEDDGGTGLSGVPVTFTTTTGSVSPAVATTDASGVASTTLTTSVNADVTATAGAQTGNVTVRVAAKSGLSVTASPTATSVGTPVTFDISTAATANLSNARIDYGDGRSASLGSLTGASRADQHIYAAAGVYSVSVTASDSTGAAESAGTTVVISALGVTLGAFPNTAATGIPVTFSATFDNGTPSVSRYVFTFIEEGTSQEQPGHTTTHVFATRGIKTVRVDVFGVNGQIIGTATTQMNIT